MSQALHILVIQAMAGVDSHAELVGQLRALRNRLEFGVGLLRPFGVRIAACVKFDEVGGDLMGRFNLSQIKAAHKISADFIELHTGRYANAKRSKEADAEFEAITQSAKLAYKLGMGVNAGHGLNYQNVKRLTHIAEIVEYNIGHSIIARAVLVGLDQAVREMKALLV